ncbi:hypothetical protein BH20ACI2_BH20ACI2_28050 [soil metagenome]
MKPISNRVFMVVAATLSFVMGVNSLGLTSLAPISQSSQFKSPRSSDRQTRMARASTPATSAFSNVGITFEENRGQAEGSVRFLSRSGGVTTLLTDDSAWFYLSTERRSSTRTGRSQRTAGTDSTFFANPEKRTRSQSKNASAERPIDESLVQMKFEGARPESSIAGEKEREGKVNYLRGNDPSAWVTGVPTFETVRYSELYDGVDLVYYGNELGQMEYDFEVAPGADSSQISLSFSGAESIKVDETNGDLVISTLAGELRHHEPVAFQYLADGKQSVDARYETLPGGKVSFQVGEYDVSIPLIIDPIIGYSTYLGGSGDVDFANSVTVDGSGNAYLTGSTNSANFPTLSPFDGTFGGDQFNFDAFVTKMNATGTAMIYSTYLGGSSDDNGLGIAIDGAGQAYITGFTNSSDFPTASPFQALRNGTSYDGFLTKLNASGSGLVYSTYLGGSQNDSALSVAIDGSGFAYVAGETASSNFPSAAAFQLTYGGGASDAFVTKFNQAGNGLVFSTFLGGTSDDLALGIAVNASGVHVAGATTSTNFPLANAADGTYGGGGFFDGFVSKLNAAGSALTYSTYLGGSDYDAARGIALDSGGNAYITGTTASTNFPVLAAFQATRSGTSDDAFITKLSAAGAFVYSTYLGGTGTDHGSSIAVDPAGTAYVTGSTSSTNFPTADPLQATSGGATDAFVTNLSASGSSLVYSTYIGGSSFDDGIAIAIDSAQNVYVAGGTDSANFPTVGPFQAARSGASDAFLLKISALSLSRIEGQVFTSLGQGLRNATVTLTDQFGVRRSVPTSSLGFYSFDNVVPGQPYVLSVVSRRYRFTTVNVNPNQAVVTINFTGLE